MPYEGEYLTYCPASMFNFLETYAVLVTGNRLNPYGHMLLNTGGRDGMFFQVAGMDDRPRILNAQQFERYMSESKKQIISVTRINIKDPAKAQAKLDEIMSEPWLWGGVTQNCETMVEDIVVAGGGPPLHKRLLTLPIYSTNVCQTWDNFNN